MINLLGLIVIILCVVIGLIITSKRAAYIWNFIKFEIIFNLCGAVGFLEDIIFKSNNDDVELPEGKGKIAVITGGTRGIGVEVVKSLVRRDVHVIIGCRSVSAGMKLFKGIRDEGITTGHVQIYELDLCSLKSVKAFAASIKSNYSQIDILINNAGKMLGPYVKTVDGFESQIMTNYLGHFYLTHLLIPELKAAGETSNNRSRLVFISSCGHFWANDKFSDFKNCDDYIATSVYLQSKLAIILFSNYLNALFKREGALISTYCVHPGIVNTNLLDTMILHKITPNWGLKLLKNAKQGAASIVYASLSRELENKGGTYISNCRITSASRLACRIDLQKRMFELTKSLLNINSFGK